MVKMSDGLVPGAGLHLAIRSGRGLPTEFLMMSVIRLVSVMLMMKPNIVTCDLWKPGRASREYIMKKIKGQMPA